MLRGQTFSILTLQVPDGTSDDSKLNAAKIAGETIGVNNLLVHEGAAPAFISPTSSPAEVYLKKIADVRSEINEIGLEIATINQRESGIALQMRFQSLEFGIAAKRRVGLILLAKLI